MEWTRLLQFMTGNECFIVRFNDGFKWNGQGIMQFTAGNQHGLLWDLMTEWTRLWESRKVCLIFNGPSI